MSNPDGYNEVRLQLGKSAVPRNTLVITTPYSPSNGNQRPEVKHGPATFIIDPLPGGQGQLPTLNRSSSGSNGGILPGIVIGNYLPHSQSREETQKCKPNEITLTHAQLKIDERNEIGSDDVSTDVSKPEVSSVDILLGPRGSNLVNIQSEVQINSPRPSQESSINLSINNNRVSRLWPPTKSSLETVEKPLFTQTKPQKVNPNGKETSLFTLTKPQHFNVSETALYARTKPRNVSANVTKTSIPTAPKPNSSNVREMTTFTGTVPPRNVTVDATGKALIIGTKPQSGNARETSIVIETKPQDANGSVVKSLLLSGNKPHTVNVRTLSPPGVAPPEAASSPVSFQGEVRGHFSLFAPPVGFQDSPSSSPPPSLSTVLKPISPRSILTGSAGAPHFRFSPSLTRRRPCRLQTVPEAPSVGQGANGGEGLEEEDAGNPVPANEDRSQLFTSVVNFKLDRDRADADGHVLEDGTRPALWAQRGEVSHPAKAIPPWRSQEANLQQTECRVEPLTKEPLTPEALYSKDPLSVNPQQHILTHSPPGKRTPGESDITPELPLNGLDSSSDLGSEPEVGLVVEGGEGFDPRRRQSYRISAISDDGFRAWTQNARARSAAENGHILNGVGDSGIDGNGEDDDIPAMEKLKNVASRLKLSTRRPSVQAWRERVVGKPLAAWKNSSGSGGKKKSTLQDFGDVEDESEGSQWAEDRLDRVNEALSWIRRELLYMREQDQTLARYLITLRHDIQQVKLARSYAEHQETIEDAADELEEARHLSGHSDTPPEHFSTPLKQFGVTRMNINSRRFSVF